jgi:hypothetical protein
MSSNYPPNQPPSGGYPPQPPGGSQYPPQGGYPPHPGGAPQKSGGGKTVLYVLGGCVGLILIGVILFFAASYFIYNKAKRVAKDSGFDSELMQKNPTLAAAKMVTAMNPDLEVVSADDQKGTLTIRNKKTGETITINAQDASKGKIKFKKDGKDAGSIEFNGNNGQGSVQVKTDEGTTKFGSGSSGTAPSWIPNYAGAEPQWDFSAESKDGYAGTFHFITRDSMDRIATFYEEAFKSAGLTVTTASTQSGQNKTSYVTARDDAKKLNGTVTVTSDPSGGNRVTIVFASK